MMSRFPIVPPECIFNNNRSNHSFLFLSLFPMSLLCESVRLCCCFYIWIYKYENSLPKLKKKRGEKRSKTNSLIYIVYSPKNKCFADCLYTYVLQRCNVQRNVLDEEKTLSRYCIEHVFEYRLHV